MSSASSEGFGLFSPLSVGWEWLAAILHFFACFNFFTLTTAATHKKFIELTAAAGSGSLRLIGTSQGGLDHPEEIHGTNGSGGDGRVAYKNELEDKAQFEKQLQERSGELKNALANLQAMAEAHEVKVNKLIDQATFEVVKANNLKATLTMVYGELELERKARVEAE
ncbi:hypothetical protein D8674_017426 [Pyrus ussuriensis x Pyrus communis]|uniref:Uncharacterized protein n=1 Tax=Pyrus ussuriensis x Pyrus communis TaxID=2448454 RepID=A0A5N5HCM9_9ROSA|nr:hypothetical protein D8674_017426 [Pyrus ussuriensis x Pyrus communis]